MKIVEDDKDKAQVAHKCRYVREGNGAEDAVATLIENTPEPYREAVFPKIRRSAIKGRALRKASIDCCPRNDESIAYISDQIPDDIRLSEVAALQKLAIEVGGLPGKLLLRAVEMKNPEYGLMKDVIQQAVNDHVYCQRYK